MWPGVEPIRSEYDEDYLDRVHSIVAEAASYGIYTLLDGHQDSFSERFCGEGVPDWLYFERAGRGRIGPFPAPFAKPFDPDIFYPEPKAHGARFPTQQQCATVQGAQYQAAKESSASYEALYTNVNGTGDAWAAMWAHVAKRFKGEASVLGLELTNEPFAGDWYEDPAIMVPFPSPGNADRTRLQAAYERIHTAVRAVDDERLIFFPGVTWDDAGPGFSAPPGGAAYANRSVLAYHLYTPPQLHRIKGLQLERQRQGARRLGTGLFLTETNKMNPLDDWKGGSMEWAEVIDEFLASWAFWGRTQGGFKPFCRLSADARESPSQEGAFGACKEFAGDLAGCCANETLEDGFIALPNGTYASAVAGSTHSVKYNQTTHDFRLVYAIDPTILLPTEIRLNPSNYPRGVFITVSPASAASAVYNATDAPTVVAVHPLPAAAFGMVVIVTVKE